MLKSTAVSAVLRWLPRFYTVVNSCIYLMLIHIIQFNLFFFKYVSQTHVLINVSNLSVKHCTYFSPSNDGALKRALYLRYNIFIVHTNPTYYKSINRGFGWIRKNVTKKNYLFPMMPDCPSSYIEHKKCSQFSFNRQQCGGQHAWGPRLSELSELCVETALPLSGIFNHKSSPQSDVVYRLTFKTLRSLWSFWYFLIY